jgi:hypothetical protein
MATAAALLNGWQYEIKDGDFAGEIVTILDSKPVADGQPNQRKVLTRTPEGQEYYILPRQLKDVPVGIAGQAAPAPVVVSAPVTVGFDEVNNAPAAVANASVISRIVDPITDPMDPRLDHLRPSRRKHKQYVGRDMGNGMTDTEFLLAFTSDPYRADGNNAGRPASVLLKGDTQSGKTMLVEVLAILWADAMGLPKPMPIFTISGSAGVTDFDLFGQTTSYTDPTTGRESLVWLPGMVELAAQVGGILYLDEVNALDPRVTSSLHPLIDHRHMFVNRNKAVWSDGQFMSEVTSAHLDLWVIGTLNESYAGMGKLNEAFVNRFEHVVWGYNGDVEQKLIKSAAIRLLGDALRTARERNSVRTPVGTAALQRCERNVATFGPVMGLFTLTSMFAPQERPIVESIIEDRSIIILLNEELRQAAAEARSRA